MSRSVKIYIKPLTKQIDFKEADPERVLKHLDKDVLKRIKSRILQTTFSKRAKIALAKSVKVKLEGSSLVVTAFHPAFFPLVKGQKKQQMTWLKKARHPIPIITEQGKLIFRWATARSMTQTNAKGNPKWTHPGRRAQDVIEKARVESLKYLEKRVAQVLRYQIKVKAKGR
jgi:hypothetical protein